MKKFLMILLCISMLITSFVSCDKTEKNENENENENEQNLPYELVFQSYGAGTCMLKHVYVNDDENAKVLEIPETAPTGERVVRCNVDVINDVVPVYILANVFEEQILSKIDSLNAMEKMQVDSFFKKYDINDTHVSEKVKEQWLLLYPFLEKASVYILTTPIRSEIEIVDNLFDKIGFDDVAREASDKEFEAVTGHRFDRLDTFEKIKIPKTVEYLEMFSFTDCKKLTSIEVDEENTVYKSIDGNLYSKDGSNLVHYSRAKSETTFSIPDGVVSIWHDAFYECNNLRSIVIPESVGSIGAYSFRYCDNLTEATFTVTTGWYDHGKNNTVTKTIIPEEEVADAKKMATYIVNGNFLRRDELYK